MLSSDREAYLADLAADGFGWWLSGFIDGEGCFAVNQSPPQKKGYSMSYAPAFSILLRDDDAPILDYIMKRTGVGRIRTHIPNQNKSPNAGKRTNSKPQAMWRVRSKEDCLTLVLIIDRFPLRAKKAKDYAIWRDAVMIWKQVKFVPKIIGLGGMSHPLQKKLAELKQQIGAAHKYPNPETIPVEIEVKTNPIQQASLFD